MVPSYLFPQIPMIPVKGIRGTFGYGASCGRIVLVGIMMNSVHVRFVLHIGLEYTLIFTDVALVPACFGLPDLVVYSDEGIEARLIFI